MPNDPDATIEAHPGLSRRTALGIVGAYAGLSALWILLSDRAVLALVSDAQAQAWLGTFKGWLFVAVTSAVLYWMLRRGRRLDGSDATADAESGRWMRYLVAGLMLSITAVGIAYNFWRHHQDVEARLLTINRLRQQQVTHWLEERQRDVRFFASGIESALAEETFGAQKHAAEAWLNRLRWPSFVDDVLWLAPDATLRWYKHDGSGGELPTDLERKIAAARRADGTTSIDPDPRAPERTQMQFLIPLSDASILLVKTDVTDWLQATLSYWPTPTATGETILLRREADLIRFLSPMRFGGGRPGAMTRAVDTPELLSARVLRGDVKTGVPVAAKDYRGEPVLGLAEPIPGTDWVLLTKFDRSEIYRHALTDSLGLLLTGILGTVALLAALRLTQQRERLRNLARKQKRQARRLAEVELLADARARLQGVFDSIGDGIVLADAETRRIVDFNVALCEMLGRQASDLDALALESLHPATARADALAVYQTLSAQQPRRVAELRIGRADGSVFSADISLALVDSGEQPLIVGIVRDISDRQTALTALRASEERFRRLFNALPAGIYLHDAVSGGILAANQQAILLHGYQTLDQLKAHDRWLPPPYSRAEVALWLERARIAGEQRFEWCNLAADGSTYWTQVTLTPIELDGADRVLAISTDITERKRAEEQLRRLSLAIEQSPVSVVVTDLEGRIEFVNQAFLEATGYSRAEVIGANPRVLQSGHTPQATYQALWAALGRGEAWRGEFFNRRKNGEEYSEQAVITPVREADGRITHYLAVKEDISERKRMNSELEAHRHHLERLVRQRTAELDEARLRAESASQAKSAFLANMSHEIRTPMNAILGLTHLLRAERLPAPHAERLEKIDQAGQHLLGLLNDILDLSKIEAGKLGLDPQDFACDALLDHIQSLIKEGAQRKGLQCRFERGDTPAWLRGDVTRLRQALLNFTSNAVKFTERGSISVRLRTLRSVPAEEDQPARHLLRFEVADTGIGIDAATLARLFQPFEQADLATTRRFGGTGLGLVITRRLAELMGGEVGAESVPGQGSTFWFTAWLEAAHSQRPEAGPHDDAESALRQRHAGARILLAEDNPVNQEIAVDLLRAVALEVDVAADGREALRMLEARDYALVLMDIQMPELDGLAATRAIRTDPRHAHLPILAMTANAFDDDRRACEAAGMNGFVAKPVTVDALYRAVAHWLDQAASGPPENSALATRHEAVADAPPAADEARVAAALARLGALAGHDLVAGLAMVRGSASRYCDLLGRFLDANVDAGARLGRHLARAELDPARRIAHTLKGTGATLGARALADAAQALEAAIVAAPAAPVDAAALLDRLAGEINRLAAALHGTASPAAAAPRTDSGVEVADHV